MFLLTTRQGILETDDINLQLASNSYGFVIQMAEVGQKRHVNVIFFPNYVS